MEKIKEIVWTQKFEQQYKKMKNRTTQDRIDKQIRKILKNPDIGKPLKHELKGERTIYIKPFRLIYTVQGDRLILLKFEHRNWAY